MTFDEVLPALRNGKRIQRSVSQSLVFFLLVNDAIVVRLRNGMTFRDPPMYHLDSNDWEIME